MSSAQKLRHNLGEALSAVCDGEEARAVAAIVAALECLRTLDHLDIERKAQAPPKPPGQVARERAAGLDV